MKRSEIVHAIETITNLNPGDLTEDDVLEELPEWDSLTVLGIISLFDKSFGIVIKPSVIQQCRTIGEVIDLAGERAKS